MKRDIVITALLTFCLTATIFMVATSQSAEYDPWVDINDDGKIDIFDVVGMTSRYAATGDPAKNVTVKNWPTNKLAYSYADIMLPSQTESSSWISVSEYSKVAVCIHVITAVPNEYRLVAATNALTFELYVDTQTNFGENLYKTYDAPNDQIRITFSNLDTVERPFYVTVYLIA